MQVKKKTSIKSSEKAKVLLTKSVECLESIPTISCSEKVNRKIDEALAYCYMAKDKL